MSNFRRKLILSDNGAYKICTKLVIDPRGDLGIQTNLYPGILLNITNSTGAYVKIFANSNFNDAAMVGARQNSGNNRFYALGIKYPTETTAYVGYADTVHQFSGVHDATTGTLYEVYCNYLNSRKIILNNIEKNINSNLPSYTGFFGFIRGIRYDNYQTPSHNTALVYCQFYKTIITEGNKIIHNIVPCIRTADNKGGFLDIVTNNFIELHSAFEPYATFILN